MIEIHIRRSHVRDGRPYRRVMAYANASVGHRSGSCDRYAVVICRIDQSYLCSKSAFAYTIPIGIIQAITNQQITLNVVSELIAGYALPGRPVPMMMFKTYGYIVSKKSRYRIHLDIHSL